MSGLLPGADRDLVSHLSKRIKSSYDEIMLSSKVSAIKENKNGLTVTIEDKDGNKNEKNYDYVLVITSYSIHYTKLYD